MIRFNNPQTAFAKEYSEFDLGGIPITAFSPFIREVPLSAESSIGDTLIFAAKSLQIAGQRLRRGKVQGRDMNTMAWRAWKEMQPELAERNRQREAETD